MEAVAQILNLVMLQFNFKSDFEQTHFVHVQRLTQQSDNVNYFIT